MKSLRFSLPVTVVVLAIAYMYFSTVFIFIDRWFGLMLSPGLMNTVVFTGVAVMCVFNYFVPVFMDSSWVPSTYMPDVEDSGLIILYFLKFIHHLELGSSSFPVVLIQIPMFNEREVYKVSIGAACGLSWPSDRLVIQVLDDSTDPTIKTITKACEVARKSGALVAVTASDVSCIERHYDDFWE